MSVPNAVMSSYWRAALYTLSVFIAIVAAAPVDDRTRDQSIAVKIVRYASKADVHRYRKTRCFILPWATRLPKINGARAWPKEPKVLRHIATRYRPRRRSASCGCAGSHC